uniref:Uncharacterized protein n=2 Tax=Nothobranchius furzeri TaxID=105023 RepID=A0A1A8B4I1_NOTFU
MRRWMNEAAGLEVTRKLEKELNLRRERSSLREMRATSTRRELMAFSSSSQGQGSTWEELPKTASRPDMSVPRIGAEMELWPLAGTFYQQVMLRTNRAAIKAAL